MRGKRIPHENKNNYKSSEKLNITSSKITFNDAEFPSLHNYEFDTQPNPETNSVLLDYKTATVEQPETPTEDAFRKKGWVYLYKNSLIKKNNSFFQGDEDEDVVNNNTSLSLEMKTAIQLMNKNWEKNKEYDMEMMSAEQYLRIYRRSEYLCEMDPDQEEDEENNESYDDYDNYE
jgi:hypothetical protein